MKVIIIEDELRTAQRLKNILEKIDPDIYVLDILASVEAAVNWINQHDAPDLMFADIQLGDGLSFDIFRQVDKHIPVVFCTAFDEYAIRAFESHSIDYLLKPLEESKVAQSVQKFEKIKGHYQRGMPDHGANLRNAIKQLKKNYKRSLMIHFRGEIIPLKVSDICYVHSSSGTVTIYTVQKTSYIVSFTMEYLESIFDPDQFYKANRQFLVNRDSITGVEHYFNRRLVVKVLRETPDKILISKSRAQEFLDWMET